MSFLIRILCLYYKIIHHNKYSVFLSEVLISMWIIALHQGVKCRGVEELQNTSVGKLAEVHHSVLGKMEKKIQRRKHITAVFQICFMLV